MRVVEDEVEGEDLVKVVDTDEDKISETLIFFKNMHGKQW